jgi:hypothetical protein
MVICFKLETATIITEKSVDVFGVHLGVKLLASFSKSHSFLIELLFNLLSQIITISTIKLTSLPLTHRHENCCKKYRKLSKS